MADTKRNALAELSVRLGTDALSLGADKYPEIAKAQRIVAELSRVGFTERGQPRDEWIACEAVEKCRAIAEEGGES